MISSVYTKKQDAENLQRMLRCDPERILKLEHDPEKHNRVQSCLCRMCYYGSRIGGHAITVEPCMCCGEEQTYGSTNTDALCLNCAKTTGLCKHCGADIELRVRRQKWPKPTMPREK